MPTDNDPLRQLTEAADVRTAVDLARQGVDVLLRHRMLRRRSVDVSAEVGLRCARASAALDDVDVPLDELRAALVAGEQLDPLLAGTLRANAELGSIVSTLARAPMQALARLHVLVAADVPGIVPDDLGRPRGEDEPARDLPWLPPGPPVEMVAARLAALVDVLARTQAPALVVAAVVHGELLTLRPFATGNGPVARAAARAVLVGRGLDPKAVTAPDVGHAADVDTYCGSAVGYSLGDAVGWVAHVAESVRLGAVEGLAICEALQRG